MFYSSQNIDQIQTEEGLLFCQGNKEIFHTVTACVLNSRKKRTIDYTTTWLEVTIKIMEQIIEEGYTVISSLGMLIYEVPTFIATIHNLPLIIVLDSYLPAYLPKLQQAVFYDKYSNIFNIEKSLFVSPFSPDVKLPGAKTNKAERLFIRDYWVVTLAKHIFIAEVRSGGNIEKLTTQALSNGKKVKVFGPKKFNTDTAGNEKLLAAGAEELTIDISNKAKESKILSIHSKEEFLEDSVVLDEYLFHYTRAYAGPWPTQPLSVYIQSLIVKDNGFAHTGFDTLCRILKEQRIRASNKLIRDKISVVSFTACLPSELYDIRRWNPGLIRWTFEPYGIGIKTKALAKLSVKPVIYAAKDEFYRLPVEERYRFQLHLPPKIDWSKEKEYRIIGDIDLNNFSTQDIMIIVANKNEAAIIRQEFALPVIIAKIPKCFT